MSPSHVPVTSTVTSVRSIQSCFEHMMEAVHRYEGTVNQVIGDGIMVCPRGR
jgi:class 3 adenylate cyclase